MDYQEVLSRFTYDDGTDIRNRISAVEAGDYRENRDIINEIVPSALIIQFFCRKI